MFFEDSAQRIHTSVNPISIGGSYQEMQAKEFGRAVIFV